MEKTNTGQEIWNALYNAFSDVSDNTKRNYIVAGIMGNLYAESGLRPDNMENSYEGRILYNGKSYNDSTYTQAVDNGTYNNFIYDAIGYGLAQWTYWSRKRNLLTFAKNQKKSIADVDVQIKYLLNELSSYGLIDSLNNCKSIQEASNIILLNFEKPRDQSINVQYLRADYGTQIYNLYSGNSLNVVYARTAYIRNTKPLYGNPFYNNSESVTPGFSTCITGKNGTNEQNAGIPEPGLNVLSNCVGYVNGAYNEMIDSIRKENRQYYSFNMDAKNFYNAAISYGLTVKNKPTIGGILIWGGDSVEYGHVAFVTNYQHIDNNNYEITITESGWNWTPFNKVVKTITVDRYGKPQGFNQSDGGVYLGCIYPPDDILPYIIGNGPLSNPSTITSVARNLQEPTSPIIVRGKVNGIKGATMGVRVYYKYFDSSDEPEPGNPTKILIDPDDDTTYNGVLPALNEPPAGYRGYDANTDTIITDESFEISIPRGIEYTGYNRLAILLMQINTYYNDINPPEGKTSQIPGNGFVDLICGTQIVELKAFAPTVSLVIDNKWCSCTPYIYHNGRWLIALPNIYDNSGIWKSGWRMLPDTTIDNTKENE